MNHSKGIDIVMATDRDIEKLFSKTNSDYGSHRWKLDTNPVRPFATDFQQWLWFHYRYNFMARFVCTLPDMPATSDRNDLAGYFLLKYWLWDELGDPWSDDNFTQHWENIEIYHHEDEYTDSPKRANLEDIYNQIQQWGQEYSIATRKRGDYRFYSAEPKNISTHLRFDILKRDNYRCQICGASSVHGTTLEIDHIVARSKGGTNFEWNLWTLCKDCNSGKSNKSL